MDKKIFLEIGGDWSRAKPLVVKALESGFYGVIAPKGLHERIKELGKIETIEGVETVVIKKGEGVAQAVAKGRELELIAVDCSDWRMIPWENLVAEFQKLKCKLLAIVRNTGEAEAALGALEKGVGGIILQTNNVNEVVKTAEMIRRPRRIDLAEAEVTGIEAMGMGDRICVDTITNMRPGQGMLVGASSNLMFLVEAEVSDNPYVEARPFRVNAGALYMYTYNGDKTSYLSEMKAGSKVTIVSRDGRVEESGVGRAKFEKRPMILVKAKVGDIEGSMVLQNAETVRVMTRSKSISVTKLKTGDKIVAYLGEGARHFGMKIDENIVER